MLFCIVLLLLPGSTAQESDPAKSYIAYIKQAKREFAQSDRSQEAKARILKELAAREEGRTLSYPEMEQKADLYMQVVNQGQAMAILDKIPAVELSVPINILNRLSEMWGGKDAKTLRILYERLLFSPSAWRAWEITHNNTAQGVFLWYNGNKREAAFLKALAEDEITGDLTRAIYHYWRVAYGPEEGRAEARADLFKETTLFSPRYQLAALKPLLAEKDAEGLKLLDATIERLRDRIDQPPRLADPRAVMGHPIRNKYYLAYALSLRANHALAAGKLEDALKDAREAAGFGFPRKYQQFQNAWYFERSLLEGPQQFNMLKAKILSDMGRKEEAAKEAAVAAVVDEKMQDAYVQLYRAWRGTDKGMEDLKTNLEWSDKPQVPDFTFTSLDGKTVTAESLRGKVVLIDFWTTWCGPCIREIPDLIEAHHRFPKDQFVLVSVACDATDAPVRRIAKARKFPFPVYYVANCNQEWFQVKGYPTKYLITREGKMRELAIGPGWTNAVEKALAQ